MAVQSLHALLTPGMLLRDSDGDGIADGVAAALHVADDLESCTGAVDLAARLGLESTGLTLPLVEGGGEFPVHIGPGMLLADGTSPAIGVGLAAADASGSASHGSSGLIGHGPDGGLVVTGSDPRGAGIAARYLAARYPYLRRVGVDALVVPVGTTALLVDAGGVIAIRLGGAWQLVADAEEVSADAVQTRAASTVDAPAEGARLTTLDDLFRVGESLTIALHPGLTLEERKALIDFAARLGVESTSLRFPLVTLTSDEASSASTGKEAGMTPGRPQAPLQLDVVPQSGSPWITLSRSGVAVAGAAALRYLATATDLVDLRQRLTPRPGVVAEEPYV
ncbi:MAG: hypothetical protein M1602_06025, partial [Firmicutes bacterium]|nr:hypothetical protein [Bacillota bacterium]